MHLGAPMVLLREVDSTNNYAMGRIAEGGVKEGAAWLAWSQKQGRGQRGKTWHTAPGENLNLSLVLQPVMLQPREQFLLSAVIALSVYDLVKRYAGVETCIKWSNDIYWRDKKAGGILIENLIRGAKWEYAVIGIGLNLNQLHFPEELPNPVSLRQICGDKLEPQTLAEELCRCIEKRYTLLDPRQPEGVLKEYESRLFRLQQSALFRMGTELFEGVIQGIEPDGRLILQRGAQMLRLSFGEVRFVV